MPGDDPATDGDPSDAPTPTNAPADAAPELLGAGRSNALTTGGDSRE